MEVISVTLNDDDGTTYRISDSDVDSIVLRFPTEDEQIADGKSLFEVVFRDKDRVSVKIPYHSVLLWR